MRIHTCSGRAAAAGLTLVAILCFSVAALTRDPALAWMLRLAGASVSVAFAPGTLVLLAWRPRRHLSILEVASIGFGISFGLLQLLTVAAMLLHRGSGDMLGVLWVITAVHGGVVLLRRRQVAVTMSPAELLLAGSILVVAAGAYLQGSPFTDAEDYIHIAIIRRLVDLQRPAVDNIYFVPHVIYTYPFPGTHYAMALMARLGGVDPLFLYHKLRAVWVVAALSSLYAFTRVLFSSRRVALATSFTAVTLLVNGTFGTVQGLFWGQLAPFSHTSDIAMGVLLPSLLLVLVHFLRAGQQRAQWFFGTATLMLAFMLTVVHTREIVQVIVYLGASSLALAIVDAPAGVRRRAMLMLCLTAALVGAYLMWHRATVPVVGDLVASSRPDVARLLRRYGPGMLFGDPSSILSEYIRSFPLLFYGWTPLVILTGPLILYSHRRRRVTVLIAASILAYLVIIRVPILGAAYVWGTYFEILFTPVRNLICFIYVLAGVGVYTAASWLARWPTWLAAGAAVAASVFTAAFFRVAEPVFARWNDLLFATAIAEYALLAYLLWRRRQDPLPARVPIRPRSTAMIAALLLVPAALLTAVPDGSPMRVTLRETMNTPAAVLETFVCEETGGVNMPFVPTEMHVQPVLPIVRSCPPPAALVQFVTDRIPADSVFVIDKFGAFPLPVFVPRQIVAWPGTKRMFLNEEGLFRDYFQLYRESLLKYGAQPFFNDRESRTERADFIGRLGVTHVLINPTQYAMMTRVLGSYPDVFRQVFDNSRWAVYEVTR